ncbi:MAG: NAD-dependent epimerase/dehydratase family protein [Betaproteobacteria bacterium]|nr:NAD-dependent epimerase/dehydratase family protein [Betaproteobacteria bacterium]
MSPTPVDRIVITGATGFVGRALAARLPGFTPLSLAGERWRDVLVATDLRGATVIHLGARVHDPHGREDAFHADNVVKTQALVQAAAAAGARRFVFASSVKVFGEESPPGRAFAERDPPHPEDAYARSKLEAERAVLAAGIGHAIVRIPLVWGAGVRGNFRALLSLAASGVPLPFAGIDNRRSLVHVEDAAEALALAATHPGAEGRAWSAAPADPVSTPGLVAAIRAAMAMPPRLFAIPVGLLEAAARLAGRGEQVLRLTRSLEADGLPLRQVLGWRPTRSLEGDLAATVDAWRQERP